MESTSARILPPQCGLWSFHSRWDMLSILRLPSSRMRCHSLPSICQECDGTGGWSARHWSSRFCIHTRGSFSKIKHHIGPVPCDLGLWETGEAGGQKTTSGCFICGHWQLTCSFCLRISHWNLWRRSVRIGECALEISYQDSTGLSRRRWRGSTKSYLGRGWRSSNWRFVCWFRILPGASRACVWSWSSSIWCNGSGMHPCNRGYGSNVCECSFCWADSLGRLCHFCICAASRGCSWCTGIVVSSYPDRRGQSCNQKQARNNDALYFTAVSTATYELPSWFANCLRWYPNRVGRTTSSLVSDFHCQAREFAITWTDCRIRCREQKEANNLQAGRTYICHGLSVLFVFMMALHQCQCIQLYPTAGYCW